MVWGKMCNLITEEIALQMDLPQNYIDRSSYSPLKILSVL